MQTINTKKKSEKESVFYWRTVSSCLENHWFNSSKQAESPDKNWLKSEYAKYIPSSAF